MSYSSRLFLEQREAEALQLEADNRAGMGQWPSQRQRMADEWQQYAERVGTEYLAQKEKEYQQYLRNQKI